MTMQISAYGRLTKEPKAIKTRTGNSMAINYLAIKLPSNDSHSDKLETEFCDLVAFGKQAEILLQHQVGDSISVSGNVQCSTFGDKRQLVILVDSIISAKTVHQDRSSQSDFKPIPEKAALSNNKAKKSKNSANLPDKKAKRQRPTPEAIRAAKELLNTEAMMKQNQAKGGEIPLPFDDEIDF